MARATLTAAGRADYLSELDRAVAAADGYTDRYFRVADEIVLVRFAGPAPVADLTRALAPVEVEAKPDPSLTIHVWQGEPGLGPDQSVSACEAERDVGYLRIGRGAVETVAPFSPILAAWLPARGVTLVHAGAVGTSEGCVMLAGGGGSGKSTTVLACLDAGISYLADDTALLGPDDPPQVFSIYDSVQVAAKDGQPKTVFHAAPVAVAPLRAIAIPQLTGERESRIVPASSAATLAALAPTSILRLPVPREAMFRRLARVAESVPCHRLEVGTDPSHLATTVEALL